MPLTRTVPHGRACTHVGHGGLEASPRRECHAGRVAERFWSWAFMALSEAGKNAVHGIGGLGDDDVGFLACQAEGGAKPSMSPCASRPMTPLAASAVAICGPTFS